MKAIRIPNTTLLDVSGRPIALNHQELHHASFIEKHEHHGPNYASDTTSKGSNGTNATNKPDNARRLAVIGKVLEKSWILMFS